MDSYKTEHLDQIERLFNAQSLISFAPILCEVALEATDADFVEFWGHSVLREEEVSPVGEKLRLIAWTGNPHDETVNWVQREVFLSEVKATGEEFRSDKDSDESDEIPAIAYWMIPFTVKVDPSFLNILDRKALGPEASEPSRTMTLGCLYLEKNDVTPDFFDIDNKPFLRKLSWIAQERFARLWKQYQSDFQVKAYRSTLRHFKVLQRVTESFSRWLLLDDFMSHILEQVQQVTKSQRCFIILLTPEGERKLVIGRNQYGENIEVEGSQLSNTVVEDCLEQGRSVCLVDALSDSDYGARSSIVNMSLRTIIAAPMTSSTGVMGVLYTDSTAKGEDITAEEMDLVEHLATTAAIALENHQLLRERIENERITKENEQLRVIDQRKTEILRTVAHELRSPLSVIVGYGELLQRKGDNEIIRKQSIERILDNSHRMNGLLNSLLDIFKLRSGMTSIQRNPLPLGELLQDVVSDMELLARKKQIAIETSLPPNVVVLGDRERLTQVLVNIIGNAIKFSPEETSITCRVTTEGIGSGTEEKALSRVHIHISDQGYGIPRDEFEKIFEIFHRVNHPEVDYTEGSGLGLSISQAILEAHGGSISVESEAGKGSTFTIELPGF